MTPTRRVGQQHPSHSTPKRARNEADGPHPAVSPVCVPKCYVKCESCGDNIADVIGCGGVRLCFACVRFRETCRACGRPGVER